MFAPSVDLRALAEKTEGFSGADLQALVYNAHLEVVHDAIAALPPAGAPNGAAATNATNGDGPEVRYTVLGGEADGGQVRSRAEEAAFQRRVSFPPSVMFVLMHTLSALRASWCCNWSLLSLHPRPLLPTAAAHHAGRGREGQEARGGRRGRGCGTGGAQGEWQVLIAGAHARSPGARPRGTRSPRGPRGLSAR